MQSAYEELQKDLQRFAYSIAAHEQEAHDLIQHALEKALKQNDLSDWPRHKQKAWFYRVMKNHLVDERRKHKRETELDESVNTAIPFGIISSFEMVDLLKKLPATQSDIIFKRYWLGLSSKEIALKLDIPASTVRYHLAQAMKTLRNYLEEE